MKADYKNWVPKGMIYGFGAGAAGLAAAAGVVKNKRLWNPWPASPAGRENDMKHKISKGSVQETLLIPLYGRKMAMELYRCCILPQKEETH